MTIPNGTGASWFELGYLTLIEPTSAPNTPELANTFIYRPRGPQSSEGWFLTVRHDLERWYPGLLPDELLSTDDQATYKAHGWNTQSVTLKVKNQPASFGNVDSSLETDLEISGLYLESAYVLPEYSSGVPANYQRPSSNRSNFADQETEPNNSWDMQLCLVHVVDSRWYSQHGTSVCEVDHLQPRPYLMRGESFGAVDNIDWGTNVGTLNGTPDGIDTDSYSDLLLAIEGGDPNASTNKTNAEFPTLCRNYNLVGLPTNECYWEVLNEISHTTVRTYSGSSYMEPKGSNNNTTDNERTNFKNLGMLHKATNDMRHKKGAIEFEVLFPLEAQANDLYRWGTQVDLSSSPATTTSDGQRFFNMQGRHRKQYVTINVTLDSSSNVDQSHRYYNDSMSVIYGDNKIPSGTPLDSSSQLKGRLLARCKPYISYSSVWDSVTNKEELANHAKELVTLRAKEFHYQSGKNFFNETYLGFLNFTPTVNLSAIIWSDTGAGATTKIVNRPFSEDNKTYTESPNFIHPKSVNSIHIDEFPVDNFYGTFNQPALVTNTVGDRKDFFGPEETFLSGLGLSYGTPNTSEGDRSQNNQLDVTVKNKTRYPLFNSFFTAGTTYLSAGTTGYAYDTVVEILWNRQDEEWQTYSTPTTLAGVFSNGSVTIYYFDKNGNWASTGVVLNGIKTVPQMAVSTQTANVTIKRIGLSHVWVVDAEACPA